MRLTTHNSQPTTRKKKFCILHFAFCISTGFTLIETLVAIAILSIAMTGPLVIAQKGLSSALYDQDEITATYLAQDAIEYVRNVRDINRINSVSDWLTPFDTTCMSNGENCQIDTTIIDNPGEAITLCSGTCALLDLNSFGLYGYNIDSGYGYTPGSPTIFTRTVTISYVDSLDHEALVTSKVSWQTNIFTVAQSITISEHIFNL